MNRLIQFTTIFMCIMLILTGCNYRRVVQDSDYDYGSRQKGDPKMLGARMYGSTTGNPKQHDNAFVEYSSLLTREVTKLNGVRSALVMLTDKNAYVAVTVDYTAAGTLNEGGSLKQWDQSNGGTIEGVYDFDTGSPYWDNSHQVTPYNSYFTTTDHHTLSDEMKQTIAARVRGLSPRVDEVHISANMDFVNEITEYAKEAWAGRSIDPWLNQFNVLVKHQFAGGKIMPVPLRDLKQQAAGTTGP
ncbi:hypothetical protein DNH61_15615 [Paenibacillus sambharensis]|uniref:Uncharacterized protein n=1 Tax=Paenibacillus sambharensis TaxID=1803190 RepID=A0A2W1LTF5_9BACL|nr:YhcN/YlaJ family sporulation lipoprotein [Paenibacillus sambharensis]PZD95061.1 hypothetical protein DNH61_15615 [Paenibacillus sambharensis]